MKQRNALSRYRTTEECRVAVATRSKLIGALLTVLLLTTARSWATIYYIHPNHLGSPLAVTDPSGAVVWRANSDPFGKANVTISTVTMNLRLPGQYFDAETGMHYNYFRDYDPISGRYLQSDPIGLAGGINTYAYALSNPLRYFDAEGLQVRFRCRSIVGGLAEHCWVYISCPEEGWDRTLSLFPDNYISPLSRASKSMDDPRDAGTGGLACDKPVTDPKKCRSDTCEFERAVLDLYEKFPLGFVPYSLLRGPNSNSFASGLITGSGARLPSVAPSRWGAPGIGVHHPGFLR